jgi:peptidoglycan/LPS O-acetylase OafA/YrhL
MQTRLTIAKTLLWVATASALAAGVSSISPIINADDAVKTLHLWVCIGYFTFAVVFGILAWKPKSNGSLWAIAFINKLALTISAAFFVSNSAVVDAKDMVIWDGMLVLLLLVAFILSHKSESEEKPVEAETL